MLTSLIRRTSIVLFGIVALVLVACGSPGASVACAATLNTDYFTVVAPVKQGDVATPKPKPPAPKPPAPKATPKPAPKASPIPKPSVVPTTGVQPKSSGSTSGNGASIPKPPAGTKTYSPPGEKAYVPPKNTTQPAADIKAAKASLKDGQQLSRKGKYTSPVTRHVYVYHSPSYFSSLGWHDPYNPYDPYNWTNPYSPWNGYHFAVVDHC